MTSEFNIQALITSRLFETCELHRRYVNPRFVGVLEAIGCNRRMDLGAIPGLLAEAHRFPAAAWEMARNLALRTARHT